MCIDTVNAVLFCRHVLSLQDEIVALRKENDELKTGLAKMRKSNVQVGSVCRILFGLV